MNGLKEFLNQVKLSPGDDKSRPFTHTTKSLPSFPSGKYNIKDENLDNFLIHYCNAVHSGATLSITEKPGPYGPLRADFDLKSPDKIGLVRQYNEDTLKAVVKIYQDQIKDIIRPTFFDPDMLTCIVLEKRAPRFEDGKICDGFHLHFPNFICDAQIQDKYIRPKVIQKMIEMDIWKNSTFIEKLDRIVDDDMGGKLWMMYGSMNSKSIHSTPYEYNRRQDWDDPKDPWAKSTLDGEWGHVYDYQLNEISMFSVFETLMADRKKKVKYYLPRFLSIRGYTQPTKLIEGIDQKLAICGVSRKARVKKIIKVRSTEDVLADITFIKESDFMNMLSLERASNYDDWMDVGWTLFCIGEGHEECLKMWIDYSQKVENYKPGECETLWATMEVKGKTMGSLREMAKKDSPKMYADFMTTNVNSYIYKSVLEPKPKEYDVMMVAYAKYKGRFCCADATKNIWYEFRDHRWHRMEDTIALKVLIVEDIMEAYKDFNAYLAEQAKGKTIADSTGYQEKQKKVLAIISELKTIRFVKNVIEMCKIKMHDATFHKKMNENRNLLACENGVLDLEFMTFREGRPDDYCTFSTGVYYQEYNDDDEEVYETDLFLQKVFTNPNINNYFCDCITSCMQGGNVNKRFIIATGPANGGKSMTFKLLGKVFGDYMGKFPRQLLLRGNGVSSGQARPELSIVRGKRIMSTQEITHMDNLDIGTLKELTGNDSFFTRGMYESGGDVNPQFTLFLQCNDPPNIPGHDEATWSRIRIVDCDSKFVLSSDLKKYPVPKTLKEQMKEKRFHADTDLVSKFEYMAPVLLWRSFKRFAKYKKYGLYEPDEVAKSTEQFQNRSDIYLEFITARVKKVEDGDEARKSCMKLSDVYSEFTEWYKESYPSYYLKEKIGKPTVKSEITRRLGVIHDENDIYGFGPKASWWGYVIIQEEDKVCETTKLLEQ